MTTNERQLFISMNGSHKKNAHRAWRLKQNIERKFVTDSRKGMNPPLSDRQIKSMIMNLQVSSVSCYPSIWRDSLNHSYMYYNRDRFRAKYLGLALHLLSAGKKGIACLKVCKHILWIKAMSFKINMSSRYIKIIPNREDSISSATHINRIL